MSRRIGLGVAVVVVALAVVWAVFLRAETVTITVTDVYRTDSQGEHPLPEEAQRPETLDTQWVVAREGLTYQAHEGRFVVGKRYRCSVATPDTGIELRACEAMG